MDSITITARDPRCPYCGRPVLGLFVRGGEGRYHPECTQPPVFPVVPLPNPLFPMWNPNDGLDFTPQITC